MYVLAEKATDDEELEYLVETAKVPIFGIDLEGRITEWNLMFGQISGYSKEEVLGSDALKILTEPQHCEAVSAVFRDTLAGRPTLGYELPGFRTKYGGTRQLVLNLAVRKTTAGKNVGLVAIGHDITDFRDREADLLEAVEHLAGGIAHDFNNLLTVILGNIRMLAEGLREGVDDDFEELLADAISAAEDASSLSQNLLAFAHRRDVELSPILAPDAQAQGSETILVVEDQARVRRFAVRCLRSLGYQTQEAAGATEALEILSQGAVPDLVFSDVIMPGGASGFELAKIVAEQHPDCGIVLTSSYSQGSWGDQRGDGEVLEILRKPYSRKALACRLRKALDEI